MFQKDITGQKFGSLTAIKFCYKKNNRYGTLRQRLKRGWEVEKALKTI